MRHASVTIATGRNIPPEGKLRKHMFLNIYFCRLKNEQASKTPYGRLT
jgi:hypothetical protein